jgi:P4 family phage/plasmid primase-like protien
MNAHTLAPLFARLSGNALSDAFAYLTEGLVPIPIKRNSKEPAVSEWQTRPVPAEKFPEYWGGETPCGVAITLGAPSKGLVDMDLDWPEARELADVTHLDFMFGGLLAFGRKSAPRSHRICYCSDALHTEKCKTFAFAVPGTIAKKLNLAEREHATNVLELRGNGGYTVFPPSVHPGGECVEWDANVVGRSIQPMDWSGLRLRAGLLAFMALMVRLYPPVGSRNDFNLALGGALLRALRGAYGEDESLMCEHVDTMVNTVCRAAGDEGHGASWEKRAANTLAKLKAGAPVTGTRKLCEMLGVPELAPTLSKWLGVERDHEGHVVSATDHMRRAGDFATARMPNLLHHGGEFLHYRDGRYEAIEPSNIEAELYRFLRTCAKYVDGSKGGSARLVPFDPCIKSVNETLKALQAERYLAETVQPPCWLGDAVGPCAKDLVSFPNGLLDVATGQLSGATPKFFTRQAIGFEYDPDANSPKAWLAFLEQVFAGDTAQIEALQEAVGYILSADFSQHKCFLLVGPKRSGKDTIRNVIQHLLPDGAVVGPTLDSLGTNFGMAQLINAHLAVVGDMRLSSKGDKDLRSENVLKLTGRSPFTIDRKFKPHWTGILNCKLLLISNEMPHLEDSSGALASRLLVFNTRASFYGKEKPELFEQELKPELPGILLWALEGLQRYRKRGQLLEPECSKELRKRLEHDGSPVLAFVEECLELGASAEVRKDVLFGAWNAFAERESLSHMALPVFMRELLAATNGQAHPCKLSDKVRTPAVRGLRLRDELPLEGGPHGTF